MNELKCMNGNHVEDYIYELRDARGIYVARVCAECEYQVKSKYRPEIFEDSGYWADEQIEED